MNKHGFPRINNSRPSNPLLPYPVTHLVHRTKQCPYRNLLSLQKEFYLIGKMMNINHQPFYLHFSHSLDHQFQQSLSFQLHQSLSDDRLSTVAAGYLNRLQNHPIHLYLNNIIFNRIHHQCRRVPTSRLTKQICPVFIYRTFTYKQFVCDLLV